MIALLLNILLSVERLILHQDFQVVLIRRRQWLEEGTEVVWVLGYQWVVVEAVGECDSHRLYHALTRDICWQTQEFSSRSRSSRPWRPWFTNGRYGSGCYKDISHHQRQNIVVDNSGPESIAERTSYRSVVQFYDYKQFTYIACRQQMCGRKRWPPSER